MIKYKIGVALISFGLLLMAAAFILTGYNMWDDYRAEDEVKNVLEQLAEYLPSDDEDDNKKPVRPTTGEVIPDYILNPDMDMPTVEIEGHKYIGTLTIPSLDLELPVMDTWNYPQLKIAPCRYVGSVYHNDIVICAHNYNAHFGRIKNLQVGDDVQFTDMDGHVFDYTVKQVEILAPTAIEEMQSGGWALTMFTCTIGGRTRVTVRCDSKK